jgi:NADH-quinone oxidoreductase subunit J
VEHVLMDASFLPLLVGCLIALVSALAVVLARRPIYAAIALLAHSLSLAGLFGILGVGIVAVGQVLIYSGAIVVLFLFVVTLLPTGGRELEVSGGRIAAAVAAGAALLVALGAAQAAGALPPVAAQPALDVPNVGRALFGPLLIAFELTAPLLLVAIIGGVVIWRRHQPRPPVSARPVQTGERRTLVFHR